MINRITITLASVVLLSACETAKVKSETVKIYKYDGSVSCNQSSGVSIETMELELLKRKIPVISANCGNDGLVRAAVCGTKTGTINVFEVAVAAYPATKSLGYERLSHLDGYSLVACN